MIIGYKVNNRYFSNLQDAIDCAKQIIRDRYYHINECSENWRISVGKKGGYCVHIIDDWSKIGNADLQNVIIIPITFQ